MTSETLERDYDLDDKAARNLVQFLQEQQEATRIAQAPHHEASLGPHRHDQGVLHVLRLHQPKNLGAKILGALRPADSAARDGSLSQMQSLDARAIHEHLVSRARLGQTRDAGWVELDRQPRARLAARWLETAAGAWDDRLTAVKNAAERG